MSVMIAESLDDALAALSRGARPIAGGTDLVVADRQGAADLPETLVAIDRLDELRGIDEDAHGVRIGAGVTHSALMSHPVIVSQYSALADAAALIGSPSTRNVGSIGGNVMNASPAMDTGAPLVVMGARVQLVSARTSRELAIAELWTGPGSTVAAPDELCVALSLPAPAERSGSAYMRLEYRRAMEIAVVGAAASVTVSEDEVVSALSIALSAVGPTIIGVPPLDLAGREVDDIPALAADAARAVARPITDLRATDRYRMHTIGVLAGRAVDLAIRRAAGESIAVPANRAVGIGAT